ncbi:hypothetical protein BU26DRAFT_322806 [Trematosphaeria pertusa]|uniref:Uncharacterized protein n=1 Tax=Trematosphaeria pertusa TaxID=390896 RepID=A0A6A6IBE9_9PLEO|nr:uncharacterized protein BU26DRAFT_322806 [Trematosphaeria pertusa]KAF2247905.1 hypothetical protein BU26DRAFT_322806 [Trematosphaeria pertusa]
MCPRHAYCNIPATAHSASRRPQNHWSEIRTAVMQANRPVDCAVKLSMSSATVQTAASTPARCAAYLRWLGFPSSSVFLPKVARSQFQDPYQNIGAAPIISCSASAPASKELLFKDTQYTSVTGRFSRNDPPYRTHDERRSPSQSFLRDPAPRFD